MATTVSVPKVLLLAEAAALAFARDAAPPATACESSDERPQSSFPLNPISFTPQGVTQTATLTRMASSMTVQIV